MAKVTVEKLDVDNYAVWSVKVRAVLITKDLWAAVSGKPDDVRPEQSEKALAQIQLLVADHHLATLSKAKTAKEAWETLEAVYQAKSMARRLQLKRELNSLRKEPNEPLTKYVSRATDLRDQLLAAGHTVDDQEVVMCILAGLPGEYDTVVTVLELNEDKLEVDEVLAKLLQAEQRLGHGEKNDNRAYFTGKPIKQKIRAGSGGTATGTNKECWYCGKPGHLKADCRKKKRDEQRGGGNQRGAGGNGAHRVVAAMGASTMKWEREFVLDSGATHHIAGNRDLLLYVRKADREIDVTFANGTIGTAEYIGDALLEAGEKSVILLEGVLTSRQQRPTSSLSQWRLSEEPSSILRARTAPSSGMAAPLRWPSGAATAYTA
jgi:hypothetical protein